MSRIVDRILSDAHAHEYTPQEARWVRIEAAARAVLDAYADPLVQSVGDSPALVELRAALDDPSSDGVSSLYAAAPDMLAALRLCADALECRTMLDESRAQTERACNAVRMGKYAIARATGGAQ